MYDIIIVGGGPAGATLARIAGKKYRVLLLEKRTFGSAPSFHKCCGGLIAPDAQLMLAKFCLGVPGSVVLSPQLFAVRTIDIDNSIERYYQRHYINIDREEFDKWLESIIPTSVDIINGSIFKSFEVINDFVSVRFVKDGKEFTEQASMLVGADGAFSGVRRQGFGDRPGPDLYVSIQEWFETSQNVDYYGAIFDSGTTDFYSWTIPKEGHLILGSALKPGKEASEKFMRLKERLKGYGFEFGKAVRREGAYLLRPVNIGHICTGNGRVALTGEAAGFISPSSAEGLSYAIRSSLALGRALEPGLEGCCKRYEENTRSIKRNILIKNLKSPFMYNRFLRKAVMKSGLMSIDLADGI